MRDILEIVFKRLRSIVLILTVCLGTTLVGNYVLTVQFESETKLLISVGREVTIPTTAMTQPLNVFLERKDQVNTQMQLLESRYLIEQTLQSLPTNWEGMNMTTNISLFSKIRKVFKDSVKQVIGGVRWILEATGLMPKVSPENREILTLLDTIVVERLKNTNVIRISFRHPNPFAAQAFLQAYLKAYMTANSKANNSDIAMDFFTDQAKASMEKLDNAEEALSRFRNEANIYDLVLQKKSTSEEMANLYSRLSSNNLEVESLKQDLSSYQDISGERVESNLSSSLRNDPIILETLKILVASKLRLTKELKKLGENNPKIISLRGELKSIRLGLKSEVLNTLKSRLTSLEDENMSTKVQLQELKARAQELDRKGIAMDQLQRKVNLLKQSFMTYSEKQETSRINSTMNRLEINSVSIIQPPTTPIKPVSPKRMLNLILGIFAGLVFGFFYAMLMEMLGATINSPDDMGKALNSKAQVFLPFAEVGCLTSKLPLKFKNSLQLLASKTLHVQATPPRILMVVGVGYGVGSTSVCAMFGRFLAERLGQKTLLVDANYINRGLSQAFKAENNVGLTDVLAGKTDISDAAFTASATLDILPPGSNTLLPATLLSISKDMRGNVEAMLEGYDLILFDASPLSSSEAFNLAKLVDGVIIVAQAEKTRRPVLRVTEEQLTQINANLVGTVLNQRKFHIPNWLYRYL